MCDSGNFKKCSAFGESAYFIISPYSGESGNSNTGDTGDLGNTNGSEESDDPDYFCTLGVSEALSVITVNLTDLVNVVHLVWGVKNVNF